MPTFFSRLFTPVMLLCTLLLIVRGRRMKRSGFLIYLAACALLMVSPLFLSVYSGSHQPPARPAYLRLCVSPSSWRA